MEDKIVWITFGVESSFEHLETWLQIPKVMNCKGLLNNACRRVLQVQTRQSFSQCLLKCTTGHTSLWVREHTAFLLKFASCAGVRFRLFPCYEVSSFHQIFLSKIQFDSHQGPSCWGSISFFSFFLHFFLVLRVGCCMASR